ncbi:MAG: hypothetical protein SNJ70_07305 [Armatimonadota bacterium]
MKLDIPIDICKPGVWKTHKVIGSLGKDIYFTKRFTFFINQF